MGMSNIEAPKKATLELERLRLWYKLNFQRIFIFPSIKANSLQCELEHTMICKYNSDSTKKISASVMGQFTGVSVFTLGAFY